MEGRSESTKSSESSAVIQTIPPPSSITAAGRIRLSPIPESWKLCLTEARQLFTGRQGFIDVYLTGIMQPENVIDYSIVVAFEKPKDAKEVFSYLRNAKLHLRQGIFVGDAEIQVYLMA